MKKTIIYLMWMAFLPACHHHHEDPIPDTLVTLSVAKPTENQEFMPGDTIFFKASISADTSLHGWGIALKRKGDDSLVYSWANHFHSKTYEVDKYWVNSINQDTTLIFQLDAAINHSGDVKTQKVTIRTKKG